MASLALEFRAEASKFMKVSERLVSLSSFLVPVVCLTARGRGSMRMGPCSVVLLGRARVMTSLWLWGFKTDPLLLSLQRLFFFRAGSGGDDLQFFFLSNSRCRLVLSLSTASLCLLSALWRTDKLWVIVMNEKAQMTFVCFARGERNAVNTPFAVDCRRYRGTYTHRRYTFT